ncbi:hypothetical protein P4E94_17035 [Pontiellaceae bacterium B12219]|nr:hypothetical protein [Pontiellaceae bacterium B12219]
MSEIRDDNWVTNSLVSPPEYSITLSPPSEYTELTNLSFTVTFTETNGIPLLSANNWLVATVDGGEDDRRLNSNEVLRLKVSYSDPDNVLMGLGVAQFGAELNTTEPWESTIYTVGATSYMISNSNDLVDYDSAGLTPLTTNNVDTWEMLVSVQDYIVDTGSNIVTNLTLSAMGGFALEYVADSDYVPPAEPILFGFDDGTEFDNKGVGVTMTRTNNRNETITITTVNIIGQDGTSATNGINNKTNIQSVNALGVNSAENGPYGSESRDFNPVEAWVVAFDVDVALSFIDLASQSSNTEMTVSSAAFSDIILLGEGDGNGGFSLSNTVVPAGENVMFQMTSSPLESDVSLRIAELYVSITNLITDPYLAWASSQGLTPGVNDEYDADVESDGMDNLLEYALGANPVLNDAEEFLPGYAIQEDGSTNYLNYVYRRRIDYAERGLIYTVGSGADLVFDELTNVTVEVNSGAINAEFESVTNQVSTEVASAQFMQLKISID